MANTPAQPDQKQRNLEAELDALLTQIQKDIPDLSPPPASPPNSPPNFPPASSAVAQTPSAPADRAKKAATPDLVDDQLAAQIQAMLDDASAQLAEGKTPAQVTENVLSRQLPPEPPPPPLNSPATPEATSATSQTAAIERIDAPLADDPSQPGYHRQVGSPAAPASEPTLSAQDVSLESLDEDLAQKANVEISGEFAPVHEVIQETSPSAATPPEPAGEKVSADDIDALIAQAVAEASPSPASSATAAATAPASEPKSAVRAETQPVIEEKQEEGTAEKVASELDEELAASADVQAVDGDFESVHEVPPAPPPSPASPAPPAAASATLAAASTPHAPSACDPTPSEQAKAKRPKAPKAKGPSFISILFKPVYGILAIINAPLNGLSPSTRNLVGFIGLITLLNAIALIAWKLSTASANVGH